VNNPLTGILGNAEMLLARREQLPAATAQRLETIAELALRVRDSVRRLAWAWEDSRDAARTA
jgi:signal transduction histidine kinase